MLSPNRRRDKIAVIPEQISNSQLARIYAQKEPFWRSLIASDCQFVFTKDLKLLSSYFQIRRDSYYHDKHMRGLFNHGEPDLYDYQSDLLVAHIDGEVIGGARLARTNPEHRLLLPTEDDDFSYQNALPEYCLDRVSYGEVDRLVIIPESRGKHQHYTEQLLLRLYARAVDLELKYLFAHPTFLGCRLYRHLLGSLDLNPIIRPDIILNSPKYDNVPMYLIVLEIETQAIFPQIKQIVSNPSSRTMLYQFDGSYIRSIQTPATLMTRSTCRKTLENSNQ